MFDIRPTEKIVKIARRHWLILFVELLPGAVVFSIMFFLPYAIAAGPVVRFITGLVAQVMVVLMLAITVDYALDAWIITNERTIYTELRGFFNRSYSSVPHDKIQDITVTVPGFLATVFHYGDLQIQTAGSFQPMIMKTIPQPVAVKDAILEAKTKTQEAAPASQL